MADVSRGAAGEVLAARFLRQKGYDILVANYRSRLGEIDLIARDRGFVVFVEVKTRGEDPWFAPREAVTLEKQSRIIATAKLFLSRYPMKEQPRFDVVEVLTRRDRPMEAMEINHIIGAYTSPAF